MSLNPIPSGESIPGDGFEIRHYLEDRALTADYKAFAKTLIDMARYAVEKRRSKNSDEIKVMAVACDFESFAKLKIEVYDVLTEGKKT